MWWGTFDDVTELAGLDPLRPDGTPTTAPAFLVCTHGRRDPCCAQRGWPVVTALTASRGEGTWQCSHVGGDRFAANLVVLPHGLYHGRVTPTSAEEIVRTYLRGRLHLPTLRGRSSYPTAVQAAQHYAREALGIDAIDALEPLAVERPDDRIVEARLATDSGEVRVVLAFRESPPISRVTCSAGEPSSVLVWELRTLESASRA